MPMDEGKKKKKKKKGKKSGVCVWCVYICVCIYIQPPKKAIKKRKFCHLQQHGWTLMSSEISQRKKGK